MARKPFFTPRLDNVSIRTKLWILVAVLAIPVVALMTMQFVTLDDEVDTARSESAGITFEAEALELVRNLQLHRDHEMRVLRGNTASQASLDQTAKAVDEAFLALREVAGPAGMSSEAVSLHSQWDSFRAAKRTSATESFEAHTEFINAKAIPMLTVASTRTGLLTDADLADRVKIEALVASVSLSEQVAQARATGYLALVERAGMEPSAAERAAMSKYLSSAEVFADQIAANLGIAFAADPEGSPKLSAQLEKQEQALTSFSAFANEHFIGAFRFEASRAESFHLLGLSAVTAVVELVTAAAADVDHDLDQRATAATRQMQLAGGVAIIGIAVALLLALVVSRSVTRPVSHLAEVADRISLGDLDVHIDVHGTNEVGQLAESLRRMQASLRSAIERLRQRRAA